MELAKHELYVERTQILDLRSPIVCANYARGQGRVMCVFETEQPVLAGAKVTMTVQVDEPIV